jgi:hypothetical protein
MKSIWILVAVVCFFLGALSDTAYPDRGEGPMPAAGKDPVDQILRDLNSHDRAVNNKAYRRVVEEHKRLAKGLIEIAATEKERYREFSDPRQLACQILGEFAAAGNRALPVLVKHVDYQQPMLVSASHLDGYPCAMALGRSRFGAVPAILNYLAHTREVSDKAIELYAWIIIEPYVYTPFGGKKEAIVTVERAIERSKSPDNLKRLLAKLKEITKNWRD